jgi:hypothetical protein
MSFGESLGYEFEYSRAFLSVDAGKIEIAFFKDTCFKRGQFLIQILCYQLCLLHEYGRDACFSKAQDHAIRACTDQSNIRFDKLRS